MPQEPWLQKPREPWLERNAGPQEPWLGSAGTPRAPFLPEYVRPHTPAEILSRMDPIELTDVRQGVFAQPAEATATGDVSLAIGTPKGVQVGASTDIPRWQVGRFRDIQGQGTADQPLINQIAANQAPASAVTSGVVKGATLGLVRPFDDRYAGTSQEMLGESGSMLIPYGGAYKVAGKLLPIAKDAGLGARTLLSAGRGVAVGAATGSVREIGNVAHGEEFRLRGPAQEAALFSAIDAVLPAAGELANYVKGLVQQGKAAAARRAFRQAAVRFGDAKKAEFRQQVEQGLADMEVSQVAGQGEGFAQVPMMRPGARPAAPVERPGAPVLLEPERATEDQLAAQAGVSVETAPVLSEGQVVGGNAQPENFTRPLYRQGQKVMIQLPKHQKPRKATVTNVAFDDAGNVVQVGVQYPGTSVERGKRQRVVYQDVVTPDQIELPQSVQNLQKYHDQLRAVPAEHRARVQRESKEFDDLLRANLADIVGAQRMGEIHGDIGYTGKKAESLATRQAIGEARDRLQTVLGEHDLGSPVGRSEALPKLRTMFDRRTVAPEALPAEVEPSRVVVENGQPLELFSSNDAAAAGESGGGYGDIMPFSIAGGAIGFEQDEQGNVTFDPKKALIGLGAGLAMAHYGGKMGDNIRRMLRGEMETRPNEPIFTQQQAASTFKLTSPGITVMYEAPGAANTMFRSVEGARYLSDISGFGGQLRDPLRNLRRPFIDPKTGRMNPMFEAEVYRPLMQAKDGNVKFQKAYLDTHRQVVELKLGIKPNTAEDRAVMDWGEKVIPDEATLIGMFGAEKAQNIKQAAQWYRGAYDHLLEEVNKVRKLIWPNNPAKIIPRRTDYFHHFQELGDDYAGLLQVFETPAQIEPALSGISARTHPKGRYLPFAMPRVTDRTVRYASRGFARYLPAASYAIHMDPQIANLRGLHKALADVTGTRFHVVTGSGARVRSFTDRAAAEGFMKRPFVLTGPQGEIYGTYGSAGVAKAAITRGNKAAARSAETAKSLGKKPKPVNLSMRGENWQIEVEGGSKNLNNYIGFINDYADQLAGKTHWADRWQEKLGGVKFDGRKLMRLLTWSNNRVKANTILGNAGSMAAQVFNIPQAAGFAGHHMASGAADVFASMRGAQTAIDQSPFIRERYFGAAYNRFESSFLRQAIGMKGAAARPWVKQGLAWALGAVDEQATRWIWHGMYRKARADGYSGLRAVLQADDWTRNMVAGRGVGEVPLLQQSRTFQVLAPFQLEVGNLWWAFQDMMGPGRTNAQAAKALATAAVTMWIMNRGAEFLRGSGVGFDPIDAMWEAGKVWGKEDLSTGQKALRSGGRVAGEVLSSVPLGQTIAAAWPEYGQKDFVGTGVNLPTRRQLFGRNDPTRYGSGLLVMKGVADPLYKFLPPMAGVQAQKTYRGAEAAAEGHVVNKAGKTMYPVDDSPENVARLLLFGPYSTPEARRYFEQLYEKQPAAGRGSGRVSGSR